jgi:hypothetical protein
MITAACSLEEDSSGDLLQSYGVVREDTEISGKLYIRNDKGQMIIPSLSSLLSNNDRNKRVWVQFSTADILNSDTIKANVYELLKIAQMNFKPQNDESVSDVVYLQKMWVAQDFLTLVMDVSAASEKSLENHNFTMYLDEKHAADTLSMEFKYDRNDDSSTSKFTKAVALKLDDIIGASEQVILVVKYKTDTGFSEYFMEYKK